jgi:translation elongation factor EF-G
MKATAIAILRQAQDGEQSRTIENKVDRLLAILHEDTERIQKSLSQLNELRSLVVKRNDTALGKLLEDIQAESDSCRTHEMKRHKIRKELANALGCPLEQVTLSTLEAVLPDEKKAQITRIKAKLEPLVKELKREHLSTVLLLSECARFNGMLLRSIFDLGKTGTVTYNSNGATRQQADAAFLNLKL